MIPAIFAWLQSRPNAPLAVATGCGLILGAVIATVLVQFALTISTSRKGNLLTTMPIPRSRQRAYFCL